ncbi:MULTISPECIES: hypothetical protein [unclassified Bradyrhizobium]|uniref:hypothetical protein n=1 Tax=unclassified Bradyrhizobium TaxID=2631580 RepID=UPI001FF8391C|nr:MULTISPECIES: hypothetical protein [unclassified Bradyrhizobium]MCK1712413.1 hypothetical protein [Bradyrhizobium sp. 143]MCK1724904.1 hypothetical protein [Bradyrhizobium sp. 142]
MPFPRFGGDVEQDQYPVSVPRAFEGKDIVPRTQRLLVAFAQARLTVRTALECSTAAPR